MPTSASGRAPKPSMTPVDPGAVDRLVPAHRVAHRSGRQAGSPIGVRVLALVVDLRHAVADPVALRVEAAHVDRLDRADLRALEADLALVLAERVVDQVEAAAPALRHLRALLRVLARHLGREQCCAGSSPCPSRCRCPGLPCLPQPSAHSLQHHDRDGGHEQVHERQRQEHLPGHPHQLVDAHAGQRGAQPAPPRTRRSRSSGRTRRCRTACPGSRRARRGTAMGRASHRRRG